VLIQPLSNRKSNQMQNDPNNPLSLISSEAESPKEVLDASPKEVLLDASSLLKTRMKSEAQIKHKLSQVRFRHLKREVRNGLSRKSSNCIHNGVLEGPGRPVGVCLLGSEDPKSWDGGVCDDSGDRAGSCPSFSCRNSKEKLKQDFNDFLRDSDIAHVAAEYPDIAALLWVLAPESVSELESEMDLESDFESESSPEPKPDPEPKPEMGLALVSKKPPPSDFWSWLTYWFGI